MTELSVDFPIVDEDGKPTAYFDDLWNNLSFTVTGGLEDQINDNTAAINQNTSDIATNAADIDTLEVSFAGLSSDISTINDSLIEIRIGTFWDGLTVVTTATWTFGTILGNGSIPAGGTTSQSVLKNSGTDYDVDWADVLIPTDIGSTVQAWDADLDVYAANPLTAAELGELQNINSVTISNAQWVFLGDFNQALTTTSNVSFGTGTFSGILKTTDSTDSTSTTTGSVQGAGAGFTKNVVIGGFLATPTSGNLTISAGAVTATGSFHQVTAESGGVDDLTTINGGFGGAFLIIRGTSGNAITVKDTTSLRLEGNADFALSDSNKIIEFIGLASGIWSERTRSNT